MSRVGWIPLVAAMLCCADEPAELVVDLKTDYVGGIEVTTVDTRLFDATAAELRSVRTQITDRDLTVGVRLAELRDLTSGTFELRVALGGPLAFDERTIRVEVEGGTVGVTAIITRDCAEVTCPADVPELSECLGGICIDPACSPENPAACPPPRCTTDTDCSTEVACAQPACVDGTCSARAGDGCPAGQYCDPTRGCRSARVEPVLAMGRRANCFIGDDGLLYAVGRNEDGQLGDGTMVARATPAPVDGLTNVVHASGGADGGDRMASTGDFFCAVQETGETFCWGENPFGGLGDGTTTPSATAVRVPGIDAIRVALGAVHACALLRDGTVSCWGGNESGQLGSAGADSLTPIAVPGVSSVVEIDAGDAHTCALDAAGTVVCWGNNDRGQVLAGGSRNVPPTSAVLPGPAVQVACGPVFTCAALLDGSVSCWGVGPNGELGRPDATPGPVLGIDDAVGVAASHRHACAIRGGGEVWCWGDNSSGELGDGTLRQSTSPVQAVGLVGVIELDCGGHNTCARTHDSIYCWGTDASGELATGVAGDRSVPTLAVGIPGY